MSIKFIYKRLGNSKLTVLLSCYFALISIHACSIHSLITSGDITPYANNKVSLIFLCLCWFSGLLLFFFSILSNAICVEVLLGMGMLSRAVGRYSLLHTERLFVSSSRLTFTLGTYVMGELSDSAFYLGVAFMSVLLAWNRSLGLDYVE